MGFFYEEYLEAPCFDEKFSKDVIRSALEKFLDRYDFQDDSNTWFEKVKEITNELGFTTDMKAYKANPSVTLWSASSTVVSDVRILP